MPSGSPMPARGRLRRIAGHVVGASAAAARPGQPRLINVGPEEQSPAARSPWAGWGIGSYEDPDDGTDYSWRDELIEPGVHHQLFIDDGALAAAVGITRTLQPPRKVGVVLSSPLAGFDCQSRNSPQWNPEKGLWEWWVMAQRHNLGDGDGADGGGTREDRHGRSAAALEKGQAGAADGEPVFAHPDAVRQKDYHGNEVEVHTLCLYATSADGESWEFPALGRWVAAPAFCPPPLTPGLALVRQASLFACAHLSLARAGSNGKAAPPTRSRWTRAGPCSTTSCATRAPLPPSATRASSASPTASPRCPRTVWTGQCWM